MAKGQIVQTRLGNYHRQKAERSSKLNKTLGKLVPFLVRRLASTDFCKSLAGVLVMSLIDEQVQRFSHRLLP